MVLVALMLPAASGCARQDEYRPFRAGDEAPRYAAPLLRGDTVRLAELQGSPVLLNVWATWCPPCREEMPGLQALHERYGSRGLRVVAVSVDARGAEDAVDAFVEEYGLTFTILHDPADAVSRIFRIAGVPETYLIGSDGRIVHRWIGRFEPLSDEVTSLVEAALDS